jgi:hypothetical protein
MVPCPGLTAQRAAGSVVRLAMSRAGVVAWVDKQLPLGALLGGQVQLEHLGLRAGGVGDLPLPVRPLVDDRPLVGAHLDRTGRTGVLAFPLGRAGVPGRACLVGGRVVLAAVAS